VDLADFRQARQFMFQDVRREIELAKATATAAGKAALIRAGVRPGGGNFMAALALLCYTEFGGKLKYGHMKNGKDRAAENFNSFFDELGPAYAAFRKQHKVYDIFRCGLAHEYYVKEACSIAMLGSSTEAGVRIESNGHYRLVVEPFCHHLERAFDRLEKHLYPTP